MEKIKINNFKRINEFYGRETGDKILKRMAEIIKDTLPPNGEVYNTQMDASTNPSVLKQIAQTTGGIFYRATSRSSLRDVYNDIDKLEKTKLKINNYDRRHEAYQPFAIAALVILLLEVLLRYTWLRKLP